MMYQGQGRITEGIKYLLIITASIYVLQIFPGFNRLLIGFGSLIPSAVLGGQIWRLVTYMFLHHNPMHLLFNMFMLWMFGVEIEERWGARRFVWFYFIAGIGSGIISLLMLVMGNPFIYGASGAVYGVTMAYAWLYPDRQILFLLLFPIKIKYAAMIMIAISILSLGSNDGVAHLTHLGGIVVAILYLKFYNNIVGMVSHQKSLSAEKKMRQNAENVMKDKQFYEDVIDPILKKISKSGIDSLSANERDTLDRFSKQKGKNK